MPKLDDHIIEALWGRVFSFSNYFVSQQKRILIPYCGKGSLLKINEELINCTGYDDPNYEIVGFENNIAHYQIVRNNFPRTELYYTNLEGFINTTLFKTQYNRKYDVIINTVPFGKIKKPSIVLDTCPYYFEITDYYQYCIWEYTKLLAPNGYMFLYLPKTITDTFTFHFFCVLLQKHFKIVEESHYGLDDNTSGMVLHYLVFEKRD